MVVRNTCEILSGVPLTRVCHLPVKYVISSLEIVLELILGIARYGLVRIMEKIASYNKKISRIFYKFTPS